VQQLSDVLASGIQSDDNGNEPPSSSASDGGEPPYSAFEHLTQSLFLNKKSVMSLLTVYCDESGTDAKNRVACVAGYIGQISEWRRFEQDWMLILKKSPYRVKMMHRSNLETWHGEFTEERGWDEERRKEFLRELHPIIRSRTRVAVGIAVIKEDWEAVMPEWFKEFFGGVYGWCAHECVVAARVWCERSIRRYNHPINWVFEKATGIDGQRQVAQMFAELERDPIMSKEFRIGSLIFASKEVVPLQAADVLAYEVFKQVENQIVDRGEKRDVRLSVKDLTRAQDLPYMKYWDKARLREWLANSKEKGIFEKIKRTVESRRT
jgi:Protein of unknown function (DUF3800)